MCAWLIRCLPTYIVWLNSCKLSELIDFKSPLDKELPLAFNSSFSVQPSWCIDRENFNDGGIGNSASLNVRYLFYNLYVFIYTNITLFQNIKGHAVAVCMTIVVTLNVLYTYVRVLPVCPIASCIILEYLYC